MVSYKLATLSSIGLHTALLSILLWGATTSSTATHYVMNEPAEEDIAIINAVSVDQEKVEAAMAAIQTERAEKHQAELAAQAQAEQQLEQARQQRQAEEQRLAELQQQAAAAEQQQREQQNVAARQLAELEKQQTAAQEQLAQTEHAAQEAEQQRQLAEEAARAATQARQAEVNRYAALIRQAIEQEWIVPEVADRSLSARFEIQLAPNGSIINVRLIETSGQSILDRSAETAIYKAAPLPVPNDIDLFDEFRVFTLTVNPENIV